MMKHVLILSASLAFGLTAVAAHANDSAPAIEAADGSYEVAGLAWRCGKNNPAMWGTIGNGCLKQKRAAKRKASSSTGVGNLAIQPPPPPPPPPPQQLLLR